MFSVKIHYQAPEKWDEKLMEGNSGSIHLFHSTLWADRLVKLLNYKPIFFIISENEKLCFILLGFVEPCAKMLSKENIKKGLHSPFSMLVRRRSFIWHGQPVSFYSDSQEAYTFLAKVIDNFLSGEKLSLGHGEWPILHENVLPAKWNKKLWATLKVDLTRDIDEIFASFKSSARKEIRKSESKGVLIKKIQTHEELVKYLDFIVECAKRYKKSVNKIDYNLCWEMLRRNGYYFETFVSTYKNNFIAGLTVWGSKKGIQEIGSFQSEYSYSEKISGPDLIKWEIIKWAKRENIQIFDLAGVNPNPTNEKELNIRKFKEKWGGQYNEYINLQM